MKRALVIWLAIALTFVFSFPSRAQSILFNFDDAPLHSSLPLDLTAGGVTAHFSSGSAFYNYSIQRADVLGFTPAGFSGNCIYPSTVFQSDLLISFNHTLTDISILYAPEEYDTNSSCTMRMTAYLGTTLVGTSTYSIDPPGTWPSGVLSFSSASPFDNVVIHYDKAPATGGDYGPIFMADNLVVTPTAPPAPFVRVSSISRMTNGHMLIEGSSIPFAALTVEATFDLSQPFVALSPISVNGGGTFQFEDVDAPNFPTRFYRLVLP